MSFHLIDCVQPGRGVGQAAAAIERARLPSRSRSKSLCRPKRRSHSHQRHRDQSHHRQRGHRDHRHRGRSSAAIVVVLCKFTSGSSGLGLRCRAAQPSFDANQTNSCQAINHQAAVHLLVGLWHKISLSANVFVVHVYVGVSRQSKHKAGHIGKNPSVKGRPHPLPPTL